MTDCDMCGKLNGGTTTVRVEGTEMTVCATCAKFGTRVQDPSTRNNNFSKTKRVFTNPDENLAIRTDYARIIKSARETKKLTQQELATKISEKESLLHSIESGHKRPSIKLARKLQKFFHISLLENIEKQVGSIETPAAKAAPLTMEEMVKQALLNKKNK